MLSKNRDSFRIFSIIWIYVMLFCLAGCGNASQMIPYMVEDTSEDNTQSDLQEDVDCTDDSRNAESLIESCYAFHREIAAEGNTSELELLRSMVNFFGENGYAAVDSGNQVDMAEYQQVLRFCEKADAGEEEAVTIIEVVSLSRFVQYDLHALDGKLDVVRAYYQYENGDIKRTALGSYMADYWKYTEDGYLVFSGIRYSEQLYVLTVSKVEEHVAFRVQPLDEIYRELNRQYILPISYRQNNMFLTDWSDEVLGDLELYDLYDIFYADINARPAPYPADANLSVGAVYHIPEDEFEQVIMAYIDIDREMLRSKTIYYAKEACYEYKPRGFYEAGYTNYPYPEVVGCAKNGDGTITLTVNVVFPYMDLSKVYAHEVVIRPLEGGKVRYVSNRVIPSKDNHEGIWYTPRLSGEEWEELYGSTAG